MRGSNACVLQTGRVPACMAAPEYVKCVSSCQIQCVWSYVLLNITKIQQPSVMPLVSNLMLHACCPSIMDSYLQAGPSLNSPRGADDVQV